MAARVLRLACILAGVLANLGICLADVDFFLRTDFNDSVGHNQSGWQSFTGTGAHAFSTSYGTVTVTPTGDQGSSPYYRSPGISDNPPALTYAAVYNDFIYNNGADFSVALSGLLPSTVYYLRLYSYDSGLGGAITVTNTFTPINGTGGSSGTIIYTSNVAPVANDTYGTSVVWTSTPAGVIDFRIAANNARRLNGFELGIPEPAGLALLAAGAVVGLGRCRRRP